MCIDFTSFNSISFQFVNQKSKLVGDCFCISFLYNGMEVLPEESFVFCFFDKYLDKVLYFEKRTSILRIFSLTFECLFF